MASCISCGADIRGRGRCTECHLERTYGVSADVMGVPKWAPPEDDEDAGGGD